MEHLEGVINKPEAEMSPQELQLHYFKMHDYDGNNLLDGLELSTAITHVHKEVGQAVAQWAASQKGLPLVIQSPVVMTCAVLVQQCCCFSFFCTPLFCLFSCAVLLLEKSDLLWQKPRGFKKCYRHFCCTPEFVNQCLKDRARSKCRAGENLSYLRRTVEPDSRGREPWQ